MNPTTPHVSRRDLKRQIERWALRASKGRALVKGRLKGLRSNVRPGVSVLLPTAAHNHYWAGPHADAASIAFLAEHLPAAGVFFDIGANVGVYAVAVAACNASALKIVAFEPIPSTVAILQQTLDLNGVRSRIEPIALSNAEGELRLSAYSRGLNNFWIKADTGAHPSISVRTQTLDAWLSKHPDLVPDAIKIDVEGHELHVLEGATHLLGRRKPALMIECHGGSWDELAIPRRRFGELLADSGYTQLRFSNGQPADFLQLKTTAHLFATR